MKSNPSNEPILQVCTNNTTMNWFKNNNVFFIELVHKKIRT